MSTDIQYIERCIQLALKGKGFTSPNPMVGAVLVHNNKIIGEGFHRKAGEPHAEVNAIASVKDKSLLSKSTLYVSLEPCSHHGKTPPCAQLIIDCKIPRVVVGSLDPFPEVSGKGIEMLNQAGIETEVGILEKECKELNKEFNTVYTKNRPYVYIKWAQSQDGFMDKVRTEENKQSTPISNTFTQVLVHKLRAETDAILVATNTAIADNPSLTTRLWHGGNPIRIVLDRELRIQKAHTLFDQKVETIIISEKVQLPSNTKNIEYVDVKFDDHFLRNLLEMLKSKKINSLMIEGGSKFLQSVICSDLWDEAFIETSKQSFGAGVKAPAIEGKVIEENLWFGAKHAHLASLHD